MATHSGPPLCSSHVLTSSISSPCRSLVTKATGAAPEPSILTSPPRPMPDGLAGCGSGDRFPAPPPPSLSETGSQGGGTDPELHYPVDVAAEARSLTSAWMVRAVDQVALWYKDHVPWQVGRAGKCGQVWMVWAVDQAALWYKDHVPWQVGREVWEVWPDLLLSFPSDNGATTTLAWPARPPRSSSLRSDGQLVPLPPLNPKP